ncbi:hypothetical protein PanWU01x14_334360 [Parasponia andersonii]|uniref:Uncharacterized protein n=1 Tax=Parasponia andersonii TaxID=3476 RepID=A0A2P5AGM7_PARAD|nr:hypothetical protein PanWU01x14_334360 [Parasponia andersonii]
MKNFCLLKDKKDNLTDPFVRKLEVVGLYEEEKYKDNRKEEENEYDNGRKKEDSDVQDSPYEESAASTNPNVTSQQQSGDVIKRWGDEQPEVANNGVKIDDGNYQVA